jgi:hypothetical protein
MKPRREESMVIIMNSTSYLLYYSESSTVYNIRPMVGEDEK